MKPSSLGAQKFLDQSSHIKWAVIPRIFDSIEGRVSTHDEKRLFRDYSEAIVVMGRVPSQTPELFVPVRSEDLT
jgi:hypothetical protein